MSGLAGEKFAAGGSRLQGALQRRIVWVTDERRDAAGERTAAPALVAVIGREHYTERRRQYPIVSRRDLRGVLRQELAESRTTVAIVSPATDDKREVAFYELRPDAVARAGRALFVVPESLVLAKTLPPGGVATVERAGFQYFVAANGVSQPSGGAVASAELFALAAGLDSGRAVTIAGDELRSRLMSGLRALRAETWLQLRMPSLAPRIELNWRPIAAMAGVGLLIYMVLASAYLTLARDSRQKELAGLGGEVDKLLVAQRDVDQMLSQQAGLAAVMADRRNSYRLWQVVSVAWGKRAVIRSIELRDDVLTLRGSAPVATDVLAAVDAVRGFADAKFSAPVRSVGPGNEEFALAVRMLPEQDHE